MHEQITIFAGPSLFSTGLDLRESSMGVTWMPPARRGDIEKLVSCSTRPGSIGLADGTFHAYPAVSHVELRNAINGGWRVYGLCSMGAIRSAEMQHMGMRPWGVVAAKFCEDDSFADDEVALVHGSSHPYSPISEPLIHIREFLRCMQSEGCLAADQAEQILATLQPRWYGERTHAELKKQLASVLWTSQLPKKLNDAVDNFCRFRLKQQDLVSFVNSRPWEDAS